MVKGYEVYCLLDPLFYDSPASKTAKRDPDFEWAGCPVPEGWERAEFDDWILYAPLDVELPPQGWKVHASARLQNAPEVVATVWDYCIPRRIPFKFIRGRGLFLTRNLKYAHRGSSGKLVTIYPRDEAQLEVVLNELGARLDGQPGPYILSDLRWGKGPLYVRYGGFAERYCIGPTGAQELAITNGDGQRVPDRRGPTFEVPGWVTLPQFLEPQLAARNSVKVDELPYIIESALHFSNGGGVYAGVDRQTGARVLLKEARPYAGLTIDGSDAVTRLRRERDMLARLAGLDAVPALHDYRIVGEHHFLVEELIEGKSVHAWLVERNPLVLPELTEAAAADYASWAMDVCRRVEKAVAAVHERGVAILDVHPSNILVRPDGRVVLIDLEIAADASDGASQAFGNAAFLAPSGATGFEVDRHALACLRLYVFLPLTALFGLDASKPKQLAAEIAALFPTAGGFLEEAVSTLATVSSEHGEQRPAPSPPPPLTPDREGWFAIRDSMAKAILASATPHRDDRLFPGAVEQFDDGGLNIAHGAAGVLYALNATGAGRYPEHEDWLIRRAQDVSSDTRAGFYDGLHGVAYVLECLGRRADALKLLDFLVADLRGKLELFGLDLQSGLAGMGLNLMHFAAETGDESLWDEARHVVDLVAGRLGHEDSVPAVSGGDHPYAGLLRGSSGPALLFMRMYDQTGEEALLDLAATALRQDLRRCVRREESGALEVNEGWRTFPYLADGSVGIALALQDYLSRREDDSFADALGAIRRTAEARLYFEPGLFFGRAGMILFLSREHSPGRAADCDPIVAAQVRRLGWHAVNYKGQLAFPGEYLVRLSMDLATGSAGILLAIGAALHDEAVHLPFLERPARTRARLDDDLVLASDTERR